MIVFLTVELVVRGTGNARFNTRSDILDDMVVKIVLKQLRDKLS